MYTYISAIAKLNKRNSRWLVEDLQNVTFGELFSQYREVIFELNHTHIAGSISLNLKDIQTATLDLSMTIVQFLESVGNQVLPTTEGRPTINIRTVHYKDAIDAGYNVLATKIGTHHEIDWPLDVARDLLLSKGGINYDFMYKHCLVTVNGLLHRTSQSVNGLYVVDGAYSRTVANDTLVGLISFADVAELSFINLHETMLFRPVNDSKHYNKAYLNVGQSLEGKTVLLSLGGYLHVLDEAYRVIGDNVVVIDFNNLPLLERYYESSELIDLSSLDFTKALSNPDQRVVNEIIESESFIKKYLNLPQSFLIVVDAPSLYCVKHLLERTPAPGSFTTELLPKWPIRSLNGRLPEYTVRRDNEKFILRIVNDIIPNYQFNTTDWQDEESVSSSRLPFKPFIRDRAFMLEIGRDI